MGCCVSLVLQIKSSSVFVFTDLVRRVDFLPWHARLGHGGRASWLRCHPDKTVLLLITWGKQSGVMVGIISAPLGGCVPATYYSCSQFWLAFHSCWITFHSCWNPRLIEKDIFLYIYLWLRFLQSRPRSCDSCLYYLQTHHCLTQPHQGPVSSVSGRQLEMLAAGLPCSERPALALALICKALQCPEAGLPARTARILCQVAAQHQE